MSKVASMRTFNYQNHVLCRLPVGSTQDFVIRTYENDGFSSQWQVRHQVYANFKDSAVCSLTTG